MLRSLSPRALALALVHAGVLCVLAGVQAPSAGAEVLPVQTLDGPSADVVGLDGTAMAPDGTGGLVYRRRVGNRVHIFAARFVDGAWTRPQRVDVGQNFDSSWPAIGAGEGGRLVVTWVQEFGVGTDRMFSASLDPGASSFQRPVALDLNVGEATATFPSLAMNAGGTAYLTYRVETNPSGSGLPSGYVGADVRIARYDGQFWSVISPLANRNRATPVRRATLENAPKVGIDLSGNGLVAVDEPDDQFIDRIYARRIFGANVGVPLLVSPQSFGGAPLRGGVDDFAVSESGFGQAAVAFRQQPGQNTALHGTRVFVNTIPEAFDPEAGHFGTARLADGGGARGLGGSPGPVSVEVEPQSSFLVGFGLGSATLAVGGSDDGIGGSERVDDGGSSVDGTPLVDHVESGAGAVAWREDQQVQVQERTSTGVQSNTAVAGSGGGAIHELRLGGSTQGDDVVAFRQGDGAAGRIVATGIDAPPQDFALQTPIGWVRSRRVPLNWDPSVNAIGGVTYSLSVDDEEVFSGHRSRTARLGPGDLPDGHHTVLVLATDQRGQQGQSQPADVAVDRHKPRVSVRARGRSVRVTVSDRASGVAGSSVRVSFGDGRRAGSAAARRRGTVHRFARRGSFVVHVTARDRAGNRVSSSRRVSVR